MNLMSLQRRRERYQIIHIWKILNSQAPNDIKLEFTSSDRRGIRVCIRPIHKNASQTAKTRHDHSFAVHGPRLWNTIPKEATLAETLDSFKRLLGKYLKDIPDQPPVKGYHPRNTNSIIDWYQSGGPQIGG